jgi:hypothetical protein
MSKQTFITHFSPITNYIILYHFLSSHPTYKQEEGYLLTSYVFGCPPLLSFSKVGESSRGCGFEEVGGSPMAAIDLSFYFQTLGVSRKGECAGLFRLNGSS